MGKKIKKLKNISPSLRKKNIITKTDSAAFTLVELIIVVAILTILSVAAFMMLTKWLSSSRDSRRMADISTIKKALEIDYTLLGHYPDPDGIKNVLDEQDNTMWYMGHIGTNVIKKIDSLNKEPMDPSDNSSYNYAITIDKQEYQVGALLENGEEVSVFLNDVNAIQREFTEDDIGVADIDGKYDGFVSYSTGTDNYIVKTESLLVRSGNTLVTGGDKEDEWKSEVTNLLVDGKEIGEKTILMDVNIPSGADNDRAIRETKEQLGLSGDNIEGDKQAIIILEDNTKEDFVPIQYNYCTLGSTEISHGYTIDTYSSSTVPFDSSCEDIKTTRICDDGTLSDGPDFQSCVMEGAQDCDLDGTAVGHGESITAYQTSSIEWDSGDTCVGVSQERVCYNGTLDGSYTNLVCSKGEADNCDANSSYSYNSHTYDVPALNHGESDTPTVDVEENNGTYKYTLSVTCNDGTYNESETGPVLVSCDTNYNANENNCEADVQTVNCGDTLASSEEWNTSNTYKQTWDGDSWEPTKSANYNENPSIDDCRYRCKEYYTWNGSSCQADTKSVACSSTIPTNATASTATTYTQTWNGTAWAPTISWTEGTSTCGFSCNENYTWNGTNCEADGKSETCGGTLPTNAEWNSSENYGQIWNGSIWTPTKSANYNVTTSTDDCRYKCKTGFHTEDSGATCVANTRSCAITNGSGSQNWEGDNSGDSSDWGTCTVVSCDSNYSITGNNCGADSQTVDCGGTIPSNATASTVTTYTQTRNGTAWAPTISWTEGATTCGFLCNATDSVASNRYYWNGSSCVKLASTSSFTVSSKTTDVINLQWNAVSGTERYYLRNNTDSGPRINNSTSTTYSFTGLTPGKTYSLTVVPVRYYHGIQINAVGSSLSSTTDCTSGTHLESGSCLSNTRTCTISNGTGSQTWNGTSRSTCSVNSCGIDFYSSGGSCIAVGNGYYSTDGSTTRIACTNHPDTTSRNYTYTSDGNGTNSCTATYTQLCGIDFYETANGTCSAVGNGYYSAANSNTRTACTNHPDTTSRNYTYTSDGNGTNSCTATYTQLCGIDFYETANGTCSAVGTGYYSAANNNTRTACSNKPTNSTYTSDGNGTNACTWSCNTYYTQSGSSCIANTKTVTCSGTIPSNSEWNSSNTYTQTRNGTAWAPTKSANYNITTSTNDCRYSCKSGYHTENSGTTCVSNTKTCTIANGTGSQTWGGTSRGTCTVNTCNTDFYNPGNNTCSAVGTGYYSTNGSTSRTACTNKPGNSNYTSDGNGSNSCSWGCITDYYRLGSACTAVGRGYYSPNSNNTRTACTNRKPSYSNYNSDGNGGNSCTRRCRTNAYRNGSACTRVNNGYYSGTRSNTRAGCTNRKPANSYYNSAGANGTNSCTRACNSGYILSGGSCQKVYPGCNTPDIYYNGYWIAACNVGASSPTGAGNYYTWANAQSACAAGYRVPHYREWNPILGGLEGDIAQTTLVNALNRIKLPWAGWYQSDGKRNGLRYWSAEAKDSTNGRQLNVRTRHIASANAANKNNRNPVRCIR